MKPSWIHLDAAKQHQSSPFSAVVLIAWTMLEYNKVIVRYEMSHIHFSHILSLEAAGKCTQSKWENKVRNGVLRGVREAPGGPEPGVGDGLKFGAWALPGECTPGSRELQRVSAPRWPPGGARARASPREGLGGICRCGRLWPPLWHLQRKFAFNGNFQIYTKANGIG